MKLGAGWAATTIYFKGRVLVHRPEGTLKLKLKKKKIKLAHCQYGTIKEQITTLLYLNYCVLTSAPTKTTNNHGGIRTTELEKKDKVVLLFL